MGSIVTPVCCKIRLQKGYFPRRTNSRWVVLTDSWSLENTAKKFQLDILRFGQGQSNLVKLFWNFYQDCTSEGWWEADYPCGTNHPGTTTSHKAWWMRVLPAE
ncbi:hypothetical protein J4Q44_G00048530 [Coregonus suidteri]|uniref:Uncharacterized protein n=1 Tax=Coregonus suidteri TaxID=861788 RepID=A0AAN8MFI9_9TELE